MDDKGGIVGWLEGILQLAQELLRRPGVGEVSEHFTHDPGEGRSSQRDDGLTLLQQADSSLRAFAQLLEKEREEVGAELVDLDQPPTNDRNIPTQENATQTPPRQDSVCCTEDGKRGSSSTELSLCQCGEDSDVAQSLTQLVQSSTDKQEEEEEEEEEEREEKEKEEEEIGEEEEDDMFLGFDSLMELGEKELQQAETDAILSDDIVVLSGDEGDVHESDGEERMVLVQEVAEDQNKDVFDEAVLGIPALYLSSSFSPQFPLLCFSSSRLSSSDC